MIAAREFLGTFLVHCIQLTHLESQQQLLNTGDNKLSPFDHATKLPHFWPLDAVLCFVRKKYTYPIFKKKSAYYDNWTRLLGHIVNRLQNFEFTL